MPEKTRDRKSWFPRFKSNWLGTYRSKQMFVCCECGVKDGDTSRYKGAEGKHCVCGKDQWHLAKSVEEAEYNRRMEISKAFGGLRYDEAVQRLKTMGASEHDFQRGRAVSDGSECGSDQPTSPAMTPVHQQASGYAQRPEFHHYEQYPTKQTEYGDAASYTPVGVDMLGSFNNQEQFAPYALSEDEALGFGEMLQDIMEDDGTQQQQQQPQQRGYYATNNTSYMQRMPPQSYASSPVYAQQQQQPMETTSEYYGGAYPAYRDMHPYTMSHHHGPFQPGYTHYAQPLTTAFASDL